MSATGDAESGAYTSADMPLGGISAYVLRV